jgi:hypothetical protein
MEMPPLYVLLEARRNYIWLTASCRSPVAGKLKLVTAHEILELSVPGYKKQSCKWHSLCKIVKQQFRADVQFRAKYENRRLNSLCKETAAYLQSRRLSGMFDLSTADISMVPFDAAPPNPLKESSMTLQ